MPPHRWGGVALLSCAVSCHAAAEVWTCDYKISYGTTDKGPKAQSVKCKFPFYACKSSACTAHQGVLHNACTTVKVTKEETYAVPVDSTGTWCATKTVGDKMVRDEWGYCNCPTPPTVDVAIILQQVQHDSRIQLRYDTCGVPNAASPCRSPLAPTHQPTSQPTSQPTDGDGATSTARGGVVKDRRAAVASVGTVGSIPVIKWKYGQNGYTIFTLNYQEVPYAIADSVSKAKGKWVNIGSNADILVTLNEVLTNIRTAFLEAAGLDKVRTGCTGLCTGSTNLPPSCDPFTSTCKLDTWRVKVFVPYSTTSVKVTVHIAPAPPGSILTRPATVAARIDPAREHSGPRNTKSGPLQVSIAGGDWGYVCDEFPTEKPDFGRNSDGADIVCKQMYGLSTTGTRLHPARVRGAGENIALESIECKKGLISEKLRMAGGLVGDDAVIESDHTLDLATGLGKESIPLGLDQCLNVLPASSQDVWGVQDGGYVAADSVWPPSSFIAGVGALTSGRRYPGEPEDCSDNEIAHVMCSLSNVCNGHSVTTSTKEARQPKDFCEPPRGDCGSGEWEMPASGRKKPIHHVTFHMGCCTGCPGGASFCYQDCTCLCQTAKSCAEIQPMQKNCQTSQTSALKGAGKGLDEYEWKVGCRWDPVARGCVAYSASPTAAPTPQPTAWPTASPTRTQPPTAYPTAADCHVGGQAICVLGYYPLWCTEDAASKSSRDHHSRPITLGGVAYHMANIPPGGAWFGDYKGTLHGGRTSMGGVPTLGTLHGTPRAVECRVPGAPGVAEEPSGCSNIKVGDAPWRDALDGTCAQYEKYKHWCEHFGGSRDHAYAGITANKACCVCGGGQTVSPTADPTSDPTPPPPTPPPPPPKGPCKWKSRDGVKKGKLGRDCTRKCPSGGRCRWCGNNGLCANSVCTCPDELFEPIPPKACLTKRASRKQGVPCLDACMKTRYWGELPAAARRGTCDWCGKGELCLREGAIHKCVCSPVTTQRRAAVAQLADEELEDE